MRSKSSQISNISIHHNLHSLLPRIIVTISDQLIHLPCLPSLPPKTHHNPNRSHLLNLHKRPLQTTNLQPADSHTHSHSHTHAHPIPYLTSLPRNTHLYNTSHIRMYIHTHRQSPTSHPAVCSTIPHGPQHTSFSSSVFGGGRREGWRSKPPTPASAWTP